MTDLKALAEIYAALGPTKSPRLGPFDSLVNHSITQDSITVAISSTRVRERRDGSYVVLSTSLVLYQWERISGRWTKTETLTQS